MQFFEFEEVLESFWKEFAADCRADHFNPEHARSQGLSMDLAWGKFFFFSRNIGHEWDKQREI